jgi:AraC family ethanolamine operon transcriptional activator
MSASSFHPYTSLSVLRRTTRARDADEQAHNLSQWDQRYDQLTPGSFEGSVTELWLPKTQIFVEQANRQLRQTCAAWAESVWFGIPAAADGMMSMGGKALSARAVCVRDGGAEFDLLTAPDFNLYGVVVDREALAEYLESRLHQNLDRLLLQGDVRDLAPGRKESLCATLNGILADAQAPQTPDCSESLQLRIFDALAGVLVSPDSLPAPVGRIRLQHQQLVERLRQLVLAQPETPPSITELCAQLHVSRRALQNCVEEITGLAPLAYIRSLRLNEVRRALRHGQGRRSVSSVAYDWGFTHMSQFAQDYRRMFGELPSASLRED